MTVDGEHNVVTFGVESAMELYFEIPGEPMTYARMQPRKDRRGMFQPDKARAYQKHAATHAMLAARNKRWKRLPKKALVALHLDVYRSERRGDLSNYVKILEDAFNDSKAIWHDDRYVVALDAHVYKSKRPRVEVIITLVETDEEEEDA